MKRRLSGGFTIAESLVSLAILAVAVIGTSKIISSGKSALASIDLTSGTSYFQDVLATRGTLVASNLLFWMNNVTNGCKHVGYFLANQVPPGIASSPFSSFVNNDFRDPFAFEEHLIQPFTSWTTVSPELANLKNWYNAFLSSPGVDPSNLTDPVAAMVSRCVNATDRLQPGYDLTNKSEFRFCVLMTGAGSPLARNMSQIGSTIQVPTLVVGEVFVRSLDGYSGNGIGCRNKDITNPEDILINRKMEMSVFVGEIRNYKAPVAKQLRSFTSRSFTAPKTRRMLINCGHCININDPAFQYECRYMIEVQKCEATP